MNEILEFLRTAQQRYESQHSVLWKVETHYTWLVYIVIGGLVFIWLNSTSLPDDLRLSILRYGSILGLILSLVGYYVVRLEGEYLWENRQIYARTLLKLPQIEILHPPENSEFKDWEDVRKKANKSFLLLIISLVLSIPYCFFAIFLPRNVRLRGRFRLTVRDAFQITLLLAAAVFILFIIFTTHSDLKSLLFSSNIVVPNS